MVRKVKKTTDVTISVGDGDKKPDLFSDFDFKEFIKVFERLDLDEPTEIVGYKEQTAAISDYLNDEARDCLLVTGPPGIGKTTIVRNVVKTLAHAFYYLDASWMLQKKFDNPETRICQIFNEAILNQPSIVFIDEIDLICDGHRSLVDARARAFLALINKLRGVRATKSNSRVYIVAATNRPSILNSQLKRPSLFSEEISLSFPNFQDRYEYLKKNLNTQECDIVEDVDLQYVAERCHRYKFEDLDKLINISRKSAKPIRNALSDYKPFAVKSIVRPHLKLNWDQIGGIGGVKQELIETIIWPLKHKDKYVKLGIPPSKGVLLYGPPGCGKTMLVQALATESGYNFISVKGPELFSKYVGDSEAAVRKLYDEAREVAPCIIFFDEIDGLAIERSGNHSSSAGDKVVTQLLPMLDGVDPLENVFTIAATNRPDRVDKAFLRQGRLYPSIYIPLPSEGDRREIFKVSWRNMLLEFRDKESETMAKQLASMTENFSGAEINGVCRLAGTIALRENLEADSIKKKHFLQAVNEIEPKTSLDSLELFLKFKNQSIQKSSNSSDAAKQVGLSNGGDNDVNVKHCNYSSSSMKLKNRLCALF